MGAMSEVEGTCADGFEPFADWLRTNQERGYDEGASLGVFVGDEPVVDLWVGTTDYQRSTPWRHDTLVHLFSTSKVITDITLLIAYDQGIIDIDAPICTYWPEFAQNGKETITTRQVLLYQSGLPGFGRPISSDEFNDWDTMIGILERATPWYPPGTESYYHANTHGFLVGNVLARASGVPFPELFRREVAEPLDADFHFGLSSPEDQARVARLWYPSPDQIPERADDVVLNEVELGDWVQPDRMAAVLPSTGGIGNGRSIAKIGALIANHGEFGGRRFLSEEMVAEAGREQSLMVDRLLGSLRLGLGFGIDHPDFPAPTPTTMHWGGWGGSAIMMDPAIRMSVGFAPNKLLLDPDPDGKILSHDRLQTLIAVFAEVAQHLG
jgi:CubicO group peptidase (beta-lactamase class C family)